MLLDIHNKHIFKKEYKNMTQVKSICDYDGFLEYIKEELIRTINSEDVIDILERKLPYETDYKLLRKHKTSFSVEIFKPEPTIDFYKYLFSICTPNGYYCSYYKILTDDENIKFKGGFDKEKFLEIIDKYNITYTYFIFEGDYEDKEYFNTNDVPDILYHIFPCRILSKIKKIGLCPTSKERLSFHPDRIYLMTNIETVNYLIDEFKYLDKKYYTEKYLKNKDKWKELKDKYDIMNPNSEFYNYCIAEINTTINNLQDKLILHSDPNYQTYGYYTYNNIPKENIKI